MIRIFKIITVGLLAGGAIAMIRCSGVWRDAGNIVAKVEETFQYPGQIRVTVVRETRCVEFAK